MAKPSSLIICSNASQGEWQTTGTHPQIPDKTFHGRTSFAWAEGGAFLTMHSEIDEPEIPSGVALIGSDDGDRSYVMIYFDERGVSRKYGVTLMDGVMTWSRDDPKLSQTMTFTPDEGGARLTSKGRILKTGDEWEDDLSLEYVRVAR